MHIYRIYDGGEFWDWAASDADRARELHLEFNYREAGIPVEDFEPDPGTTVMQLPDNKLIRVGDAGPDGDPVEKTAGQWAEDSDGEGCIGTSCH
jgi:hypothetical protein